MSNRKSWADPKTIFTPGRLTGVLTARFIKEDDDKTAVLQTTSSAAPQPSDSTSVIPSASPAHPPEAPPKTQFRQWDVVPKMSELHSSDPSLASRTRPELGAADARHQAFHDAYHNPEATSTELRHNSSGSSNAVFRGKTNSGHEYMAKPHGGIGARFVGTKPGDPGHISPEQIQDMRNDGPNSSNRHDATYSLMSAMGAHHMVVPGFETKMHGSDRLIPGSKLRNLDPGEEDDERKRLTMHGMHAGQPAHVQEFSPGSEEVSRAHPDQLDKVDAEHRLHGVVTHMLMGNLDGHAGNVLLHPSGHPVLIDHDMTLSHAQAGAQREKHGKDVFRSVFAPGGKLDYQSKLAKDDKGQMIPVGTNYPPRMKEVLARAAEGYYSSGPGKLGMSDSDLASLQNNARQLLSHGLEGTLGQRHNADAEDNQKKSIKQAQLDKAEVEPATNHLWTKGKS